MFIFKDYAVLLFLFPLKERKKCCKNKQDFSLKILSCGRGRGGFLPPTPWGNKRPWLGLCEQHSIQTAVQLWDDGRHVIIHPRTHTHACTKTNSNHHDYASIIIVYNNSAQTMMIHQWLVIQWWLVNALWCTYNRHTAHCILHSAHCVEYIHHVHSLYMIVLALLFMDNF